MNEDGPFTTFRATRADGGERHRWGILDHHFVPAEPVKDWRRKNRVTWYGTREEAEGLCQVLNRDRAMLGKKVATEFEVLSKTQRIWRMNQARKRSSSRNGSGWERSSAPTTRKSFVMKKCEQCGRMYSGEHQC